MKSGPSPRALVLFFPVVLVLYLIFFYGIERARLRKGPWVVDFGTNAAGWPTFTVSQAFMELTNFQIILRGETPTNRPGRVVFNRVLRPVPAGRVIYEDLTFLPGVITFDLYGHEVELVPRRLVADRREFAWRSGGSVELWPTNKPPTPPQPPKYRR